MIPNDIGATGSAAGLNAGRETRSTGGGVPPTIQTLLTSGLSPVDMGGALRTLDGLASAGAGVLGGIGDLAGKAKDALTSLPGDAANALADSMRGPSARTLTPGETAALRGAFGNGIDLSNVRIVDGPGYNPDAAIAFNVGGNPAITEGNTVYVRSDHYSKDFSASPQGVNTLIHEFTHVRQFQQMGFGGFFAKYAGDLASNGGDRNKVYDYGSRGSSFADETIEGQAQMVGDYAGYRAGEVKLTPAEVASIERKLNGTGIFGR